ncbi:hypothetical protein FRB90_011220 [Tulasnella sp. 427]|nr:hypothetical protein FRB90_011220 [Tulasnella sp. 427]
MRLSSFSFVVVALWSGFSAIASPVHPDASSGAPLVARGGLTVPSILANAQAQIDPITQRIRQLVPYNADEAGQIDSAQVAGLLSKVQATIDNVNNQLQQIADQPWDAIGGGTDPKTAEYALVDLALGAVKATAPAGAITDKYPELQKSVDSVVTSVTNLGPVALKINWSHFWGYVLVGIGAVCTAVGTALLP